MILTGNMIKSRMTKGFSYIEMIVYIGIVGMMVSSMVIFAWQTIYWKEKLALKSDISYNLNFAMQKIIYEIKLSTSYDITTPSSISLDMDEASRNPTNIELVNGRVRFVPGSSHPCVASDTCYITSDDVYVENLFFNDLSSAGSDTKIIRIIMTIENMPNVGRSEYEFSDTYITSVEIK